MSFGSMSGNDLLGVDASASDYEAKELLGTTDQITVSHAVGSITLSSPQDIAATSSPEFAGLTLTSFSGILEATAGVLSATSWESLDADVLDIDYSPSSYTPDDTTPAASDASDLAAHLMGIDTALGAHNHDADYADISHNHDTDYAILDGDVLDVDFTPSNYTPDASPAEASDVDDLSAHLKGIDTEFLNARKVVTGTAGEALNQYEIVYSDTADSGEWKKAQNDGTSLESDAWGIVLESGGIGDTSTGQILLWGEVTNGLWTWTPGTILYLSATAGSITETEPVSPNAVVQIGHAIDATTILFAPGSSAGGSSITWQGDWENGTGYDADDAVSNRGGSYICITSHTSSLSDEPGGGINWVTYWGVLAEKGDTGDAGAVNEDQMFTYVYAMWGG
jgi:hypothetical protein